ncbi:MAG: hypothetical protein L3J88_05825 [Gammaproteobacteria bacterium]|nr:hypothetical protein [Gammaproteobacteria bacterium]MCF6362854.1 hypothetical protein [Gammaproteobacteria bacterium]
MSSSDQFNASPSMAGYLFQCRLAFLLGLQMTSKKPNGQISIEKFDDISFDNDDIARCLIQAKHHVVSKSLGDKSVDIWKTFRIWISQFKEGILSASDTRYILITTATAAEGSAMSHMRPGSTQKSRDKAKLLLIDAAKSSENSTSMAGREAFLALNDDEADAFLSRVDIIDQHPNLIDVMAEIEGLLVMLSPNNVSTLATYVEGWWLGVVGKCLIEDGSATIPIQNIIIKANEISNMFKADTLPVDEPSSLGAKEYSVEEEENTFVKQMRMVELRENAIRRGVQDFYRASAQRSKWARENLLLDDEASKYDAGLKDRYERRCEAVYEEEKASTEYEQKKLGRKLCLWASQQSFDFRNVVETWITAGSFHGLADRMEIGWHPDFVNLFEAEKVDEDA